MTEINAAFRIVSRRRAANNAARTGRRAVGVGPNLRDERLPIERVERVVVLEPLVAAERAARQFELEDVVEDAPRAEGLPATVAFDVIGEAEARRDLLAEGELEAKF